MRKLITLLTGLGLLGTVVTLGGCASGYYGNYYDEPEVIIVVVPSPPGCGIPAPRDPVVVQSPPPRTTPMDRTPVKTTPPPRVKTPRQPRTR